MKKYLLMLIIAGFGLKPAQSQSVHFDLPAQKGKTLYLLAFKGTKQDTIFSGVINEKGILVFTPAKDNPLSAGVTSLFIKPDIGFDFIYSPKENMTLHSDGEYIHSQNTHFHNSPENNFMETRFVEQMRRREKLMFAEQGMQLYKPEENIYNSLKGEKEKLVGEQAAFETVLQQKSPDLYAARLMRTQNLLNEYIGRLQVTSDTAEYAQIRKHVLSELNTETLFRSGIWFSAINGMLELYYKQSPYYSRFGEDVVRLLEGTKSQEVFLALANDAATICNQYSWNMDEAALSEYLSRSGRIVDPQGKLKQMLLIYKLVPGMFAPALVGASLSDKDNGSLIIFYESGCNNCDNEINQLIGNYPVLREKGIEVVSVASDHDKAVFENNSGRFPWKDKLCDFNGFEGENFKNYGVFGTPTIYVIDKNGIIQGKYAKLLDTGLLSPDPPVRD